LNQRDNDVHRLPLAAFLAALLLLNVIQSAHAVTPAQLKTLIAQLGSEDPRLRQSAADDLMGIKKEDLPALHAAALSESPLLPGQIAGLHQVVIQVFLAGEKFRIDPSEPDYPRGFLGVRFSPAERIQRSDGITISDRIPGFPAYRYLHPGDVIVKFVDWPNVQLHLSDDFIRAVGFLQAGDIVRLQVLRFGRLISVSLPLDFRPEAISNVTQENPDSVVDAWIQHRQQRAENYWKQEFSGIDPSIVPDAGQASTSAEQ
jgi:hypothetical protein